MKIRFISKKGDWSLSKTGKGFFINRLIPALKNNGVKCILNMKDKADIDFHLGKIQYKNTGAKQIIRLGPAHIGKNHKKQNTKKRIAIKKADGIIYQSKFGKKMCDKFIDKANCYTKIIFNGAIQKNYKHEMKINFIASTRNWTPQKRLKDIIKAFIIADIPDSQLNILGAVNETYNHPNINLLGIQNQNTVEKYLSYSKTTISIVWLDCMPNSACEALCAGCNVITTSAGGTCEIADNLVLKEKQWDFKPANQNKPPKIDRHKLAELMRKSLTMHAPYSFHVNINNIAKQYKSFFKKVLNG